MHKRSTKVVASLCSLAMILPGVANLVPTMTASAGQVLGESTFDYKALPWHTCESSPAKQDFDVKSGAFHITVKVPLGGESSKWDLQFRHRNLNFKAGHTYKVSFKCKAKRAGMELCSKIGNTAGTEEYFSLFSDGTMGMGYHMGGQWGSAVTLSTEYKTFSGTFTPTKDLEAVEWAFHYAEDHNGYGGNAQEGDELWFDDMSIICTTCGETSTDGPCDAGIKSYGATDRHWASVETGVKDVYISANQLGYYPDLKKVAVLSDNGGDVLYGADKITLSGTYTWELVDASSGTVVKTGTTGALSYDKDSHDNVAKIDFSDYTKEGTYYLRIKDKTWRSFEFKISNDLYSEKFGKDHTMLTNALNYFYQNRSGLDISESYITSGEDKSTLAHPGGHKVDTADVQNKWQNEYLKKTDAQSGGQYYSSTITANHGWYDAGDHGKYVVNGGISVWTLQNMYERSLYAKDTAVKEKFNDKSGVCVIPEAGNGVPDILDECKYELDFIQAMKVDSSEPTWGKYAGMYYHKLHDHKWTGLATKPWDYEGPVKEGGWDTTRIVKPPTFAATLNYAACAAQAARLWEPYDADLAKTYLSEAKDAWQAAKKNWYEARTDEETQPKSLYAPMNQAKGGGPYGDNEVRDDLYWAACEIYISAKEMGDSAADDYLAAMKDYKNAFKIPDRIVGGENVGTGSFTVFNWGNTASAGSLSLLLHKDLLTDDQYKTLSDSCLATADSYIDEEGVQGYGIPYKYDGTGYTDENNLDKSIIIKGYEWGSNSMVINNLIVMAYAYDQTGDAKYLNGVVTGMDYLLGTNPLAFSYITGYGSYHEKNPHHRYWSHELDKTLPMAPDGVLSGGPNAGLQDPYVRALAFVPGEDDNPSQRCFVDSIEAWSTNEVTINWNAPLCWIVEFLQDKDAEYDLGGGGHQDPPTDDPDWGNVDCSEGATYFERVDVRDAVLLARITGDDPTLKEGDVKAQGKLNADVEYDGGVDPTDLNKLMQYLAKKIEYKALGKQ